ncbi:MAG: T9SS type A sorting domain-containing protein [Bacteroidetes bacterium]|nr:T9SS type A sorting domain-containing protein [Bacteroidota bacterium]
MKIRLIVLTLFLTFEVLSSQILTWSPFFATRDDVITIDYDVSKGNGALVGVFPVYVHTGVITNLSKNPNDWKYVKTIWGSPANQPSPPSYLGNNIWRIIINIPTYYGVPSSETIQSLAFVFRNTDGSKVGRDTDGSDIFLPISQPGLNVGFQSPTQIPVMLNLNDSVQVVVRSAQSTNLSLYLDGSLIASTDSFTITKHVKATEYGKKRIKAVATGTGGSLKSDSIYFVARSPVTTAAQPANTVDGINYTSTTSVTLVFYAPYKNYIYVVGDFNNWEVDPNQYMKRTPDGNRYWLELTNLTPQKEYIYQYFVDGTLKIADPYAEKLSDPWNDRYISSTTYPNLIEYPFGKTFHIASVLQTDQAPYSWQTATFQKPQKSDLVIYELLIRDFLTNHDYKTLSDTLNYLKTLGINAIELMPVMEFEGNESWGYNLSFHLAPDKYYGPKNDLKKFIDKAHEMGFVVLLDMVLNHAFGQSSLVRLYWDSANDRPAANSPWFNPVAKHPYNVGYDFNHESQATKDYVDRVCKFWLTEYKVDGFRFDLSKGFTQVNSGGDVGLWGQYDASRIALLKRMADKIWLTDSTAYVILEHFAVDAEEIVLSNYGMLLWGNLNYNYNEATMGWHDGGKSDFSRASYKAHGFTKPHLISYMESHDEERLMYKNLLYGNSSGTYNIKNLATALERIKLAGAFFFTIPGPKLIWQFGELGYDVNIDFNGRTGNKPIRWNYFEDTNRRKLYKTFATLIKIKKEFDVFRTNNFTLDFSGSVKRMWLNHSSMNVAIIGNFDVIQKSATPNFQNTGWWYDYFSGDSINVVNTAMTMNLQPGEFHIYSTVKLPTPEAGLLTSVESEINSIPAQFALYQNYPNPFNPKTTISYQIAKHGFVNLKIYDLLGQEISTIINEEQHSGNYQVIFDASNPDRSGQVLSSGVYFYQLRAGDFVQTRKMVLNK